MLERPQNYIKQFVQDYRSVVIETLNGEEFKVLRNSFLGGLKLLSQNAELLDQAFSSYEFSQLFLYFLRKCRLSTNENNLEKKLEIELYKKFIFSSHSHIQRIVSVNDFYDIKLVLNFYEKAAKDSIKLVKYILDNNEIAIPTSFFKVILSWLGNDYILSNGNFIVDKIFEGRYSHEEKKDLFEFYLNHYENLWKGIIENDNKILGITKLGNIVGKFIAIDRNYGSFFRDESRIVHTLEQSPDESFIKTLFEKLRAIETLVNSNKTDSNKISLFDVKKFLSDPNSYAGRYIDYIPTLKFFSKEAIKLGSLKDIDDNFIKNTLDNIVSLSLDLDNKGKGNIIFGLLHIANDEEIIKPMLEALFKEMQSSKLGPHLPFDLINVLIEYSEKNAVLDQFILSIDQRKLVDCLIKTKVNSDIILSIKETASKVNSDFLNYFSNSITFQQINQPTEKDSTVYFYNLLKVSRIFYDKSDLHPLQELMNDGEAQLIPRFLITYLKNHSLYDYKNSKDFSKLLEELSQSHFLNNANIAEILRIISGKKLTDDALLSLMRKEHKIVKTIELHETSKEINSCKILVDAVKIIEDFKSIPIYADMLYLPILHVMYKAGLLSNIIVKEHALDDTFYNYAKQVLTLTQVSQDFGDWIKNIPFNIQKK